MGVAGKLAGWALALTALAALTTLVVSDGPLPLAVLEESTEASEAIQVASKGIISEDVYRALTATGSDPLATIEAAGSEAEESDSLSEALAAEKSSSITMDEIQLPVADKACTHRGPQKCVKKPFQCAQHGPVCEHKKMCVARAKKCVKAGKCAQPGRRCHFTFSKGCIACAKKEPLCWHAHAVATTCVKTCETKCFKDAKCERECAEGCLSRYEAYMARCKQKCQPCHKGSSKKCWKACYEWKTCVKPRQKCVRKDLCVRKGKSCSTSKDCVKWGKTCHPKNKCVQWNKRCKSKKLCVRRDTQCSHRRTKVCRQCRAKSTACLGQDRVGKHCVVDCTKKCKGTDAACRAGCSRGCAKTKTLLRNSCAKRCPVCQHRSRGCYLKCLQFKTKRTCNKVCKKNQVVQDCTKTCRIRKMKKHCVGKCAKWKKNFVCHATCDKYKLTRKQQCRHKCITHGFQHICSKTRTKCVRWTGGRKCKKGPCLVTRKKAPNVVMMESIPKVRDSFQKALADVSRREMKAQSAGKAALSHAKADLRVTLGASKAQVRALMLQARRDAAHAAVMAESHAKRALDDAKAKLASMQEVPHGAPRKEAVVQHGAPPKKAVVPHSAPQKEAVVPHGAPQKEAVLKIPPPLLKMPPLPGRVKTVEPATVEPLAVDVAAKQMVEGKDEHVAAQVAAPQLSSHNSKPDADFERVLAHPGEHFHP